MIDHEGTSMDTDFDVLDVMPLRGKVDWHEMAETARANPDKWVGTPFDLSATVARHLRRGLYTWVKPEEFYITTRQVSTKPARARIYIKKKES